MDHALALLVVAHLVAAKGVAISFCDWVYLYDVRLRAWI
jgi:hypothetical protein